MQNQEMKSVPRKVVFTNWEANREKEEKRGSWLIKGQAT